MKPFSDAGHSQQREATDRVLHQILSAIADRQKNKQMVCFKGALCFARVGRKTTGIPKTWILTGWTNPAATKRQSDFSSTRC